MSRLEDTVILIETISATCSPSVITYPQDRPNVGCTIKQSTLFSTNNICEPSVQSTDAKTGSKRSVREKVQTNQKVYSD